MLESDKIVFRLYSFVPAPGGIQAGNARDVPQFCRVAENTGQRKRRLLRRNLIVSKRDESHLYPSFFMGSLHNSCIE